MSAKPKVQHQRELGQAIGDISRAWRFHMNRRLKPFGLNLSMRQVLVQLHRHADGLMQNELARKLGIEGPTLVRLLNQLEQKEWIARIDSTTDKRRKYVVLTPKANEQIQIIEKLSIELRALMMEGLEIAEMEAGLAVMLKIRDRIMQEE